MAMTAHQRRNTLIANLLAKLDRKATEEEVTAVEIIKQCERPVFQCLDQLYKCVVVIDLVNQ